MKKLLLSLSIFCVTFLHGQESISKQVQQSPSDYFYIGFDGSPIVSSPEVGYRMQREYLGFGIRLGGNYLHNTLYFAKVAPSLLFFPKPNPKSQFYLGVESGIGARGFKTAKWHSQFIVIPKAFLGLDYTLVNNHKIFFEISYTPGYYHTNSSGWDWLHTLGYSIGYGF